MKPELSQRLRKLQLWLAGMITVALSAYALYEEQSHFLRGSVTVDERIEGLLDGPPAIGLASITHRNFMIDCRNAVVSDAGRNLRRDIRTQLRQSCLDGAKAVLAASPTSSFAYLSAAHASLSLGNMSDMQQYLWQSYQMGANEGWVARYRVELVELNEGLMAPEVWDHNAHDIGLIANAPDAIPFLASLYVARESSRQRITAVLEEQSVSVQQQFVNALSRIASGPSQESR